jgi:hypothetical protein
MENDKVGTVLKLVGRWLSRLLSYAYGGFLALIIFRVVDPDHADKLFNKDLPWEVAGLACIVIGAGIYRAHRSAAIPIHHWFACFLFFLWDKLNRTSKGNSVSPTRWFNSLGVHPCRRILAYNILRHDSQFMTAEEQEGLDLKHAEFGLVVMAAEGCFFGAAYTKLHPCLRPSSPAWWVWLVVGILLLAVSYPAPMQEHAIECLRWRFRENEEKDKEGNKTRPVSATLRKYGLVE